MPYKLLVVDDDIQLCKMLTHYFERKGYRLLTACDATKALSLMGRQPDLILLDINMPGI